MSRFDRRLKGVGLRPGDSTCKINSRSSNRILNNANSSNVNSSNVNSSNVNTFSEEENALIQKNIQLEEVARTASTTEMRLITRHEIRLNNLEATALTNYDLSMLTNNKLQEGVNDNNLRLLEGKFNSKLNSVEKICEDMVKTSMNSLYEKITNLEQEVQTLKNKNTELLEVLEEKNEDLENTNKVELQVTDKETTIENENFVENTDDLSEDIKKVVAEEINNSLMNV
jgi:polyhydroxyalkanoate synthesis regulator phasin